MPLHLLGKKSWNVYNPANIAKVKADEAAAAAREAAEEERMQEVDAARRAAILRGETLPPLPVEEEKRTSNRTERRVEGHDRKRRRLAGEDDTDRDIRLARTTTAPKDGKDIAIVKLRKPELDAPLTDHAGNINLFPVDQKEAIKREKQERNAEAEKEKKRKQQSFEDQYTMRLANAAGRDGLEQSPWYTSRASKVSETDIAGAIGYPEIEEKDVWGRADPNRKEREVARIATSDPFAFMQKAQAQLKRSKEEKKKWADERDRELRELRAAEEREDRRDRHRKRKKPIGEDNHDHRREEASRFRHHRDLSHSRERLREGRSRHHRERRHHRSRTRSRSRERKHERSASHRYEQSDHKYSQEHRRTGERDRQ